MVYKLYYIKKWTIIGKSVCNMVRSYISYEHMLNELNMTDSNLLPKINKPDRTSHYRPVGLFNTS